MPSGWSSARRSSRSIRTGPGSRGGQPLPASYWRAWRAAHPEYRERERERLRRRRNELGGDLAMPSLTETLRAMTALELERMGPRALGRATQLVHTTVLRFAVEAHRPTSSETLDALADYFGVVRLLESHRAHRRATRLDSRRSTAGDSRLSRPG